MTSNQASSQYSEIIPCSFQTERVLGRKTNTSSVIAREQVYKFLCFLGGLCSLCSSCPMGSSKLLQILLHRDYFGILDKFIQDFDFDFWLYLVFLFYCRREKIYFLYLSLETSIYVERVWRSEMEIYKCFRTAAFFIFLCQGRCGMKWSEELYVMLYCAICIGVVVTGRHNKKHNDVSLLSDFSFISIGIKIPTSDSRCNSW